MKNKVFCTIIFTCSVAMSLAHAGREAPCVPSDIRLVTQKFNADLARYSIDLANARAQYSRLCSDLKFILNLTSGILPNRSVESSREHASCRLAPLLEAIQYTDESQDTEPRWYQAESDDLHKMQLPFTSEEKHLIALGLKHIKQMADDYGASPVRDMLHTDMVYEFLNMHLKPADWHS